MTVSFVATWLFFVWVLFDWLSGYRSTWEACAKFVLAVVSLVALKKARLEVV
jgi:hypothetical protein